MESSRWAVMVKIELDLTHYQACLLGRALGEWKEAYGNRDYKELASALHEALAKVGIDKSKFFPRAPEPPKKEEPKHKSDCICPDCLLSGEYLRPWAKPEMDSLEGYKPVGWWHWSMGPEMQRFKETDPLAPKEDRFYKLLDLRNELISAGFTPKEANYLIQPLVARG